MTSRDQVRFTIDGRTVVARPGQSVAAALLEAGTATLTRSSKYRRPRGIHCAKGACPNCMLRIDGRPHVRSCLTVARAGMRVETEGATTRRIDLFRAIDSAGQLFPVGFQYRYFKRQNLAWRLWERQLRKVAAETEIPEAFPIPPARRMQVDLLVVGAGPAGLAATRAAATQGLEVAIVGRRARLGGAARGSDVVRDLVRAVLESPRVHVIAPGAVIAGFGDRYVVDGGDHALEVTAPASVLATGAYERSLVFPGNDRPGVMLTSALRRLVLDEQVLDGRTAVLAVNDDSGYHQARDLVAAGFEIAAIADMRAGDHRPDRELPVQVFTGARVVGVSGRGTVTGVRIAAGRGTQSIRCDVIGMSGGWQRADELRYSATSTGDTLVVGERAAPLDPSAFDHAPMPTLQGAGAVVGTIEPGAAIAEGELAGRWAASWVGAGGGDLVG